MEKTIGWLLDSEPWVSYRTRIDLLNQTSNYPEVLVDRKEMIEHPSIKKLLLELLQWPGEKLKRHNDANHLLHKLAFLADLGLNKNDKEIEMIGTRIFKTQSPEGPFQIVINIPKAFGGTGEDLLTWILCDTPLIVYSLVKFGYKDDPRVIKAIDYLMNLVHQNGWHCTASEGLGRIRGPGRKHDPCPYTNLLMLKLIAEIPKYIESSEAKTGIKTLLELWEKRKEKKPYLFGMGTDFKKLKAPFVWYDILHVLDVLTRYPGAITEENLREMIDILEIKKDADGFFKAESIYRAWKEWDFGQKREPSKWITLLSYRILKRTLR